MLGIKTKLKKNLGSAFASLTGGKLSNDITITRLMNHFRADPYGHRANINESDLGYGWIHYALVRMMKPKNILCIGSGFGYIPGVLAQACKDAKSGHVDFVDAGYGPNDKNHWTGKAFWKTKKGREIFDNFGLKKWLTLYLMLSHEYAKKNKRQYEYIYIDADHSYRGVLGDYQLFWPRLREGGFMAFHDINIKKTLAEGKYGVYKLWKSIKNKSAFEFKFVGSGLGIIQKNSAK